MFNVHPFFFILIISLFSEWGLSILCKSKLWTVDATFSVAPAKYYQLLNILTYNHMNSIWLPCLFAFMTSKTQSSYEIICDFILTYAKENAYSLKVSMIITDFERGLQNALISKFHVKIIGCYFHMVKAL